MILQTKYHSQRNNRLYPDSTCGTTILAEYLSFLGFNFSDDEVFEAINSEKMINKAKELAKKGDSYIDGLLKKGFRDAEKKYTYLNNSIKMICETGKYLTGYSIDFDFSFGTIEEIKKTIDSGFPVGIAGMFTPSGHYVLVVGFSYADIIINDPYGNYFSHYQDSNGSNISFLTEILRPILHKDNNGKILYFRAF